MTSVSSAAPHHAPGPVGDGRAHVPQVQHQQQQQDQLQHQLSPVPLVGGPSAATSTSPSPSSLTHGLASLAIGSNPTTNVVNAVSSDLSGGATSAGGGGGSASGALPFFAQFRGDGSGDVSGSDRSGQGQASAGSGRVGTGSSALGDILGGGLGPLGTSRCPGERGQDDSVAGIGDGR